MFLRISLSSTKNKCSALQSISDKIFQHNKIVTPRNNVNFRLTLMNIPLVRRVELKAEKLLTHTKKVQVYTE